MNPDLEGRSNVDAIDRILGAEDQLLPSSGFLAAVMERVRDQAIAPMPIPFPWKRALPGIVLAAGAIGWLVYEFIQIVLSSRFTFSARLLSAPAHLPSFNQQLLAPGLWIAVALALSLASCIFAMRLARRTSLL